MANKNIGEKIRQFRIDANITQESLAEMSGLSINYISKIERSKNPNISINALISISDALEIDIQSFFPSTNKTEVNIAPPFATRKLINILLEMDSSKAENISKSLLTIINELKTK